MDEYSALRILTKRLIEHKRQVENEQNKNYFVGAILLDRRGNIISSGTNSFCKTHPYQKKLSEKVVIKHKREQIYLHAEISALVKCNTTPYTIIVARIGKNESVYRLAKPCPICQEAIKQAQIKKVYYTNNNGDLVLFNDSDIYQEEE